ncbi:MAG: hypothetical protein WAO08_07665, partial [Hyphomicrobiaceae bacterium]
RPPSAARVVVASTRLAQAPAGPEMAATPPRGVARRCLAFGVPADPPAPGVLADPLRLTCLQQG